MTDEERENGVTIPSAPGVPKGMSVDEKLDLVLARLETQGEQLERLQNFSEAMSKEWCEMRAELRKHSADVSATNHEQHRVARRLIELEEKHERLVDPAEIRRRLTLIEETCKARHANGGA